MYTPIKDNVSLYTAINNGVSMYTPIKDNVPLCTLYKRNSCTRTHMWPQGSSAMQNVRNTCYPSTRKRPQDLSNTFPARGIWALRIFLREFHSAAVTGLALLCISHNYLPSPLEFLCLRGPELEET